MHRASAILRVRTRVNKDPKQQERFETLRETVAKTRSKKSYRFVLETERGERRERVGASVLQAVPDPTYPMVASDRWWLSLERWARKEPETNSILR